MVLQESDCVGPRASQDGSPGELLERGLLVDLEEAHTDACCACFQGLEVYHDTNKIDMYSALAAESSLLKV